MAANMLDIENPRALLDQIVQLRSDVISQAEELFQNFGASIERPEFADSAHNLACYLALRRHDLRSLQVALMRWGLSSLGRSESRVQPTLDAVTRTLSVIAGGDDGALPFYPDAQAVHKGSQMIEQQAELLFGKAKPERATRIMVTLPAEAADELPLLAELLQAGVECVRINCAHDDAKTWAGMLRNLRRAEKDLGLGEPVRVLMDLGGPKVRTKRPKKQEKDVYAVGDRLLLTALDLDEVGDRQSNKHDKSKKLLPVVGCTLPAAIEGASVGDCVYIDDGQIGARVVERVPLGVVIEIFQAPGKGKKIRSDKGINFPDTDFEVASLTDKDKADLDFVVKNADMIGYSFVQTEADITALLGEVAMRVPSAGKRPGLVLKIETKRAVRELPSLIVAAAGKLPTAIMIARGDLAIELGFARIAEMQEEILWLCEAAHVPVIWATQVLEGLAKEGLPTRAEVTDAAMAGRAECVMLNKGPHIVDAVNMLSTVLQRMQGHQYKKTPQLRTLHAWEDAFSSQEAAPAPRGHWAD
jgi:pyruvate kinase